MGDMFNNGWVIISNEMGTAINHSIIKWLFSFYKSQVLHATGIDNKTGDSIIAISVKNQLYILVWEGVNFRGLEF